MIRWVVAVTGTARPRPTPATAVLTPTTRPRLSASAPPELPGLSAASVWITLSITRARAPGARRQGAAECRDDARGDRALEAVRVADRDHELADPQALGVAELGRDQVVAVGADHGEVGERIGAGDREAQLAAVDEPGAAAVVAVDDVGGGEQVAVVGEDHRRCRRPPAPGRGGCAAGPAGWRPRGRAARRRSRPRASSVERLLVARRRRSTGTSKADRRRARDAGAFPSIKRNEATAPSLTGGLPASRLRPRRPARPPAATASGGSQWPASVSM